MKVEKYISNKQEFSDIFLNLIANEDDSINIKTYLKEQKIINNKKELSEILRIISNIIKNHHRTPDFFNQINNFFQSIAKKVKLTLSDTEIFNIFKKDKLFLQFLFENKIITIDESIASQIQQMKNKNGIQYYFYFYKEIVQFMTPKNKEKIETEILKIDSNFFDNFDGKRKNGENDSYICSLIRNDSIEEFVKYVNKNTIPLSSRIESSIFETNSFLLKNKPTLIEYASFFGSKQIFQFLILNKVELTGSLWLYSIHGNNPEIIHLLEENRVEPDDETYEECLKESIKCHHNDIANYIENNLINQNKQQIPRIVFQSLKFKKVLNVKTFYRSFSIKTDDDALKQFTQENNFDYFNDRISVLYGILYHNYTFFKADLDNYFIFCLLCKYDYYSLVKFLLNKKKLNINTMIILTLLVLLIKFNDFLFN